MQAQEEAAGKMMIVPKDIPSPRGMLWLQSYRLAGWNEMKFRKGR